MRHSRIFGKTTRTSPKEAAVVSHKLLHQGGFIRMISAGRYAFLPLGFRVCEKIVRIIEEEMQTIGSQRMVAPTFHPIEIWKKTNRDRAFGQEMHIVQDHYGATFALGATAEGLMVELVKKFRPTYKDLPIYIHQFSEKFRDEERPRHGLIRLREFTMKDAYSFDVSEKDSLESYEKFYHAYEKIAKRFDLKVVPVQADSGAIGGDYNHEFIVESEAGEGEAFLCTSCTYAAHADRAEYVRVSSNAGEKELPLKEVKAPNIITAEDEAKFHNVPLSRVLNTLIYKVNNEEYAGVLVMGDQEVSEPKLLKALHVDTAQLMASQELTKLGTYKGYVAPFGKLRDTVTRWVGDLSLLEVRNMVSGSNKKDTDTINVNYGRDFEVPLADITTAKENDTCPSCKKGTLRMIRGIEWGHVFKQDLFYTKPQQGHFINKEGKEEPMWMGAYGIGIARTIATIVETHHDEKGIIWPESVAPFFVHLLVLNQEDEEVSKKADELYEKLLRKHVEVLYDDRDESAGVKLTDADLMGIPYRVVVSKKTLTSSQVELKERSAKTLEYLTENELLERL